MTVAGVNGLTTAFYDGGAVTAHNGAQGSAGNSNPVPGGISTAASGSGGGGWNVSAGGTGANIVGQGMPGFASPPSLVQVLVLEVVVVLNPVVRSTLSNCRRRWSFSWILYRKSCTHSFYRWSWI